MEASRARNEGLRIGQPRQPTHTRWNMHFTCNSPPPHLPTGKWLWLNTQKSITKEECVVMSEGQRSDVFIASKIFAAKNWVLFKCICFSSVCGVPRQTMLSFNGFIRSGCKCLEIKAERLIFLVSYSPFAFGFRSTAKKLRNFPHCSCAFSLYLGHTVNFHVMSVKYTRQGCTGLRLQEGAAQGGKAGRSQRV